MAAPCAIWNDEAAVRGRADAASHPVVTPLTTSSPAANHTASAAVSPCGTEILRRTTMNTKQIHTALAGAFLSLALLSSPAWAARVVVKVGPPAVRVEVRGRAPSPRHLWVGGYWRWSGSAHVWVAGGWQLPPRHGANWVDGHWKATRGGWVWVAGHWR